MNHGLRIGMVLALSWTLLMPWGHSALVQLRQRARRHQAWRRRNRVGWPKGMPNCDKRVGLEARTVRGRML